MEDITVHQLKEKMDNNEDFFLLDVREHHEADAFNIGAKVIPLGSLPFALDELSEYKNKEIVVHCRSGARSANAKSFLLQNGFSNVGNLLGGMLAWQDNFVTEE
jgi:rhodanese-related sulfurtransferase